MNAKERAFEIYNQHIVMAGTDGRLFRRTVMDQLKKDTGCSQAAAATHYNNAKKAGPTIAGLGRLPTAKGVRKMGGKKDLGTSTVVEDDECFTVIELVKNENSFTVGRCQAFIMQGDASEKFDSKIEIWPNSSWVMIQGLGPNHGDAYRLASGEKEIKRFTPKETA